MFKFCWEFSHIQGIYLEIIRLSGLRKRWNSKDDKEPKKSSNELKGVLVNFPKKTGFKNRSSYDRD